MQYFKPDGDFFVGDCMPFFHEDTFRLFYLLDENHHRALDGLGGHQWAQASSKDLIHWDHHPLAIPITDDREGSICTGSLYFYEGLYYAFYATRMRDCTQHLSLATSLDGVHFEKTEPNPFASPPAGYDPLHYRDPVVFQEKHEGHFHLLVTACLEEWPIRDRGGCLAHLVSTDLKDWHHREPFIIPGLPGVPECPDYFAWNDWYYLIFSSSGVARYRMSREPFGPWHRPIVDILDGPASRVMKTAPFKDGRRLGVSWIGTRQHDMDDGPFQFGGSVLFREIAQYGDGTLGAKFPEEMSHSGEALPDLALTALDNHCRVDGSRIQIESPQGLAAATCSEVPRNAHLMIRVHPQPGSNEFGLRFRADETFDSGYDLRFSPSERSIRLQNQWLFAVDRLDQLFTLEIVLKGDIIDVCIDGRRTIVDRCPQQHGGRLFLYAQDSDVSFEIIKLTALS